jgi:hypothetical protein
MLLSIHTFKMALSLIATLPMQMLGDYLVLGSRRVLGFRTILLDPLEVKSI